MLIVTCEIYEIHLHFHMVFSPSLTGDLSLVR